jgi:threonine/homoserine/homoserine lactone efflux protein
VSFVVAALAGVALGIVTGMPLGVINVAIVDAAAGGRVRFAMGVGIGGGLADIVHSGVAFAGVGKLVTTRPDLVRWLAAGAAVLIVAYAIHAWRQRARPAIGGDASSLARGVATGFLLTLPNPAALAAWVAVAAALWPDASAAEACTLGVGVGIGSATWFAVLARWIGRLPPSHKARAIIPKVALIVLVGIAGYGIVRVVV